MWLWGILAWFVAAVVVAVAHHRLRRLRPAYPAEVESFLVRFENHLAEHHPEVGFLGMIPERFACLLRIAGQETPVGLHDALRHAEAFPESFPRMVDQLLRDVHEVGLDQIFDHDFAEAAPRLLPQVRNRGWLDQQGCFGDSGLVHRRLNEELVVVYVIDDPQCMVFVSRSHLQRWRKSEEDLFQLARGNLARLGGPPLGELVDGHEAVLLQSGDGYDAARVLLLERTEGLLVAIPDRDTLWVAPESGQNLEQLMATTEEIARGSPHPVSGHLWRVKDGELQNVPAGH